MLQKFIETTMKYLKNVENYFFYNPIQWRLLACPNRFHFSNASLPSVTFPTKRERHNRNTNGKGWSYFKVH
jgi:hypothetical protein